MANLALTIFFLVLLVAFIVSIALAAATTYFYVCERREEAAGRLPAQSAAPPRPPAPNRPGLRLVQPRPVTNVIRLDDHRRRSRTRGDIA